MQGSITDTACTISTENLHQVIDVGNSPLRQFHRNSDGLIKTFSIELVNCITSGNNERSSSGRQFRISFDGESDGKHFVSQGKIKDISIQIMDANGNVARPGTPLPEFEVGHPEHRLDYTMRIKSNGNHASPGDYFLAIRFQLDYF